LTKPWEKPVALEVPDVSRILQDAEAARVGGRLADAEALCRRVLVLWPGNAEAIELMGLVAYGHGNLDRAADYLREAARAPGAQPRYFSNLAEVCRMRGALDEAESAARRAVRMDAKLPAGWNNLGIVLQEVGRLEEARACLEQVLALEPRNAQAHNNLANTLKGLDQPDEAEKHWRRALELRPDYPEALSNMVVLLTEAGDYPTAEAYGLRALQLNPRLADAYVNLGALAAACYNHDAALQLADRLLKLDPQNLKGISARALTLRQLDRLDEAYRAVLMGIAIAPEDAEIQHTLGLILQSMGRLDEAVAAFERAGRSPRLDERARVSRGRLLVENGRVDEAREVFEDVLDTYPRSAAAWSNLADLHKFSAGDERLAAMETLLAASPPPSRGQAILLHFAIGKGYLDSGDSDRAFAHLNRGNAMKRATLNYDGAANVAWIRSVADVFSAEVLERMNGAGATSQLPIFVLGMPRSGTTLVEQILASHPEVQGAGELKHIQNLARRVGTYPQAFGGISTGQLDELGRAYLAAVGPLSSGKRRVIDKMPSNFLYAGLIHLALPEARIIHCRRDPVDTCLSCYSKIFAEEQSFSYDMAELGAFYLAYRDLVGHWREHLPAGRFIDVDYEEVVADTEGQARRLLEFLGLPWDDRCLEFYKTERPVRTASVNQVRQPVYRTSAGRWRNHARNLSPLLDALGLPSDAAGSPPPAEARLT